MKILRDFPPNYKEIHKAFLPTRDIVFTYGDTIYAPHIDFTLSQDLIVHEQVHCDQQMGHPDIWWKTYIENKAFRLQSELAAYRAQYQFFKKHHSRDQVFFFASRMARDLSSLNYGGIIEYYEALKLIQQ